MCKRFCKKKIFLLNARTRNLNNYLYANPECLFWLGRKAIRVANVGSLGAFEKSILQFKFCALKICIYKKKVVPLRQI